MINYYTNALLVRFADGETEWMSEMEWERFEPSEGDDVVALSISLDVPEGTTVTDEWRASVVASLRETNPRIGGWETADESDDVTSSEFIIDLQDDAR